MYGNIYQPFVPYGQPRQEIVKVNGLAGAQAYQMAPNSVAALFDANNDVFYLKSTDGAGFPSIRIFDFSERIAQATPDGMAPVNDVLDRLLKSMDEIKEMLSDGKQPVRTQEHSTKPAADAEQPNRYAPAV